MRHLARRFTVALFIAALVAAAVAPAGAGGRAADSLQPAQAAHDYVTVKLADPPTASYMGGIQGIPRTKPLPGRKLDLSTDAARRYREYLASKRQDYKAYLQSKAPRATVVREFSVAFNGLAIKLNGENAQALSAGPGVAAVTASFLVRPAMNISPALINAPALWSAVGGQNNAGEGIKIGVIDTGVDITNAFLSDTRYPNVTQVDACGPFTKPGGKNTSNKVPICRFFVTGLPAGGPFSPFALLAFDHGTHVSGTAAGNNKTNGTVAGTSVTIKDMSGVSPRSTVGDYNVFPGFGVGFIAFGGSAFSHDIAAALEAAVADGMDVVNMSIGGGVQGPHDFLAEATNATVDAGVIAAVAAGNEGPGDSTISSPGSAEKALTAGASTNPHFVGQTVTHATVGTGGLAIGDFAAFPNLTGQTYTFVGNACSSLPAATANLALIVRGDCTFTTKIRNAQTAGYPGAIVKNNVAGDPIAMGHDATSPFPTIPAGMVSKTYGDALGTSGALSISAALVEFPNTGNEDIIAGFSSRGPTPFTFLIKPDATAPGVNVLSSVFDQAYAFFQGTSMATPHLAGSAAVLLQFFQGVYVASPPPIPYPDIVKSAIVNVAKRPVFDHVTGTEATTVLTRGGGRVDLAAAKETAAAFVPVSVSFGFHRGRASISESRTVTVFNTSTVSQRTYGISVTTNEPLVTPTVTTTALSVGAAALGSFTVSLSIPQSVPSGDYQGDVVVSDGTTTMRLPWWVQVDRGP